MILEGYSFSSIDVGEAGDKLVTVTYNGLTTTFGITYKLVTITKLEISTVPSKTTYYESEELDFSDLVLTATDSENNTYMVTEGYAITGYDSSVPATQTVTITYLGVATSIDVTVIPGFLYETASDKVTITGLADATVTSLTIPDTVDGYPVVAIKESAFKNQNNLISVSLPESVLDIGRYAFYGCISLQNINIPTAITDINSYTFYNCAKLENVVLPAALDYMGEYAFAGCTGITEIVVPDSVTLIGKAAFQGTKLTDITLPFVGHRLESTDDVYALFGYIFGYEDSSKAGTILQKAYLPSVGRTVNYYCYIPSTLKTVTITNAKAIADYAFYNCKYLTSVILNENIETIGQYSFYGCEALAGLTLPNTVTDIGQYAFYCCFSLSNINIPDGITEIKGYTFYYCKALKKIALPDSLTIIRRDAFYGCEGLTEFTVPDSVTSIGYAALQGTKLKAITLPFIGNIAGTETQSDQFTMFGYIFGYEDSSREGTTEQIAYSQATGKLLSYYCYIPNSLQAVTITNAAVIPDYAFYNCYMVKELTLNDGLKAIGKYAFYNCKVQTISLPDSLESIGSNVFKQCPVTSIYANKETVGYTYAQNNSLPVCSAERIELDRSELALYKGDIAALTATVTMRNGAIDSSPRYYMDFFRCRCCSGFRRKYYRCWAR